MSNLDNHEAVILRKKNNQRKNKDTKQYARLSRERSAKLYELSTALEPFHPVELVVNERKRCFKELIHTIRKLSCKSSKICEVTFWVPCILLIIAIMLYTVSFLISTAIIISYAISMHALVFIMGCIVMGIITYEYRTQKYTIATYEAANSTMLLDRTHGYLDDEHVEVTAQEIEDTVKQFLDTQFVIEQHIGNSDDPFMKLHKILNSNE